MDTLSARNLARYGLRRGVYDGANRRRFVLFESAGMGVEVRHEYDSKRERDQAATTKIAMRSAMMHMGRHKRRPDCTASCVH